MLKKTLSFKAINYYHPDRKLAARNAKKFGDEQDEQEYLRDEISEIINKLALELP